MSRAPIEMREQADAPEWTKAALYLGGLVAIGVILFALRPSCDSTASAQEAVVDLDRVLAAFEAASQGEAPDDAPDVAPDDAESPATTQAFLGRFRNELNEAGIEPQPIDVQLTNQGTLQGYHDIDDNQARTANEPELFEIAYDEQNSRAIASETVAGETYHRSHYYHRSGGGFWSGYMIGQMLDRRNTYYSSTSRTPPNYSGFAMSPDNYVSSARSRASAAARTRSSARGGWGGGGFGGWGK